MKNGRSHRRHSHQRSSTSSVICLPPPKPPVTAPKPEPEVERAIALSNDAEEQVVSQSRAQSRQVRRQAARQEAKALKRRGMPPAQAVAAKEAKEKAASVAEAEVGPVEVPAMAETTAPLPRNRSLAPTRRSALQAAGIWLGSLVIKRKPVTPAHATTAAIMQVKAMRTELAAMQMSLDRMLDKLGTAQLQ
jgi:hypothetical protein